MVKGDELTTRISRELSISKEEAGQIKYYMSAIKNDLNSQYVTTTNMVEALEQLGELNEASILYSKELLLNQITLTKQVGLQANEASRINELLAVNNDYTELWYDSIEKTRNKFAGTNGIVINIKKLLTDVSKISSQIFINFKGNSDNMLKAAMRAEQLGTSLEKTRDIGSSLLDFESSINSELEAELLTGKELNFERARALALQGNYAGLLEEINKNIGTYTEFQNMNVIQQEAISKAANTQFPPLNISDNPAVMFFITPPPFIADSVIALRASSVLRTSPNIGILFIPFNILPNIPILAEAAVQFLI